MLFNSFAFLIFLALFFILILSFRRHWKIISLIFSAFFYAYWDVTLLLILYGVAIQAYFFGKKISLGDNSSKIYLVISVSVSLFILGFFKYSNFFVNEFLTIFGNANNIDIFAKIILPVGISFYTFQAISYVMDIRRGLIKPTNFSNVLLYITFFPQLVAGPIVRGKVFIPQIERGINLTLKNFKKGLVLIIWGYFLKVAVADNLGAFVNAAYSDVFSSNTSTLTTAVVFYSFQIYADFCGYSLIAIGIAKTIGFHFPANFNLPYIAKSFQDFWRRWHISLSSFLKDYLYINLGGSRKGSARTYINIFITMTLGGLWHGAQYNFVLWGMLHGFSIAIERFFKNLGLGLPNLLAIPTVFIGVMFFLTVFRIPEIENSLFVLSNFLNLSDYSFEQIYNRFTFFRCIMVLAILLLVELFATRKKIMKLLNNNVYFGFIIGIIFIVILVLGEFGGNAFIYFQF